MPASTFDGVYLHSDLFEMAAAYAFHIAEGQPFVDGNNNHRCGFLSRAVGRRSPYRDLDVFPLFGSSTRARRFVGKRSLRRPRHPRLRLDVAEPRRWWRAARGGRLRRD